MTDLKGFYNEEVLHQLLADGEITRLEYVLHHSEEMKQQYIDYCTKNGLPQNEDSAETFFKKVAEEEDRVHREEIDK